MDMQPPSMQKHFRCQQESPLPDNNSQDDMNEFQLEQQLNEKINSEQAMKFLSPSKQAQEMISQPQKGKKQPIQQQQQQLQQIKQIQQQNREILSLKEQKHQQMRQYQKQQQIESEQQQQFHEFEEEYSDDVEGKESLVEEIVDEDQMYDQEHIANLQEQMMAEEINNNQAQENASFNSGDQNVNEDTNTKEDFEEVDKFWQKQLVSDSEKYFDKIIELNDIAAIKLNDGLQKEALSILYKAEKMLEFAASCGKVIDRNLIIVVLYNRACAYQSLWILDKCSKYIDGVIYNLEMSLKEEDSLEESQNSSSNDLNKGGASNSQKSIKRKAIDRELLAYKIKKQSFLVKSYLQCCAILSQQGFHVKALDTANEGANVLKRIFKQCYEFCRDTIKENEQNPPSNNHVKSPRQTFTNGLAANSSTGTLNGNKQLSSTGSIKNIQNGNQSAQQKNQQVYHLQQGGANYFQKNENQGVNSNGQQGAPYNLTTDFSTDSIMSSRKSMQQAKEEVYFQKLVVEYAYSILSDVQSLISNDDSEKSQVEHFKDAKKSLYFWKNNPENNEKHIRQELNVPTKLNEEETRSILGVQNGSEWIEGFNIGSIMHMIPVQYEEFSFFGDVMYEISKKMILEKVIYLSISYFTIATEIRFIEIDKNKNAPAKGDQGKNLDTEGFKQSQIYHLKSIQIVCKHITCKSPYINHLITSYHKHYNQNLETIQEESFCSVHENNTILENSQSISQKEYLQASPKQQQVVQQAAPIEDSKKFEELIDNFMNGLSEDDSHVYQDALMSIGTKKKSELIQKKQDHQNQIASKAAAAKNKKINPQASTKGGSICQTSRTHGSLKNEKKGQINQRKKLNLDFSSSFTDHFSAINTQSLGNLQKNNKPKPQQQQQQNNRAEFLSQENSKKNTPRGVLSIRKSTPAVEQSSNRDLQHIEIAPSHSINNTRSPSKSAKKRSNKNNKESSQLQKISKMSIEAMAQILKGNFLSQYSTSIPHQVPSTSQFLQPKLSNSHLLLSFSKGPKTNSTTTKSNSSNKTQSTLSFNNNQHLNPNMSQSINYNASQPLNFSCNPDQGQSIEQNQIPLYQPKNISPPISLQPKISQRSNEKSDVGASSPTAKKKIYSEQSELRNCTSAIQKLGTTNGIMTRASTAKGNLKKQQMSMTCSSSVCETDRQKNQQNIRYLQTTASSENSCPGELSQNLLKTNKTDSDEILGANNKVNLQQHLKERSNSNKCPLPPPIFLSIQQLLLESKKKSQLNLMALKKNDDIFKFQNHLDIPLNSQKIEIKNTKVL